MNKEVFEGWIMTDKEILIDGINISELTGEQLVCMNRYEVARLFTKLVDVLSETEDSYNNVQEDRVRMWANNTSLTAKLKRKEQECEELHSRTASIIYSLTGGRLSYSTYTLEGCEQAYHDRLEIDVERATKELQEENETLKQEVNKYKRALDTIEKFAKDNCDACKEFTPDRQSDINCRYCNATQILNIVKSTKN